MASLLLVGLPFRRASTVFIASLDHAPRRTTAYSLPRTIRSTSSTASSSSGDASPPLKRLIQPFVMKCHPDMAQQQGLPKTAQKVNLVAIQNLNSYIDGVTQFVKTRNYPFATLKWVEIEFVMAFSNRYSDAGTSATTTAATEATNTSKVSHKTGHSMTSRRRVELEVPPLTLHETQVEHHVQRQVVKLLRMADLPVPNSVLTSLASSSAISWTDDELGEEQEEECVEFDDMYEERGETVGGFRGRTYYRRQGGRRRRRRPLTRREASRQRFWNSINWNRFDRLYQEALEDAYAHTMTKNLIRDNPQLRQRLLAKILSKIRFDDDDDDGVASSTTTTTTTTTREKRKKGDSTNLGIPPLERLVAYRRLLRLLDDHFDELHLEDLGRFWEELVTIVLTKARPYNTSSSAMRKRRERNLEAGYSFTIHHDNTVTVQVPIDFTTDELVQELQRNLRDFVDWTQQDQDDFAWMMGEDDTGEEGQPRAAKNNLLFQFQ